MTRLTNPRLNNEDKNQSLICLSFKLRQLPQLLTSFRGFRQKERDLSGVSDQMKPSAHSSDLFGESRDINQGLFVSKVKTLLSRQREFWGAWC